MHKQMTTQQTCTIAMNLKRIQDLSGLLMRNKIQLEFIIYCYSMDKEVLDQAIYSYVVFLVYRNRNMFKYQLHRV